MSAPPRPVPAAAPWAAEIFTIGVTGTNGKTSTTWMIAAAIREAFRPVLQVSTVGVALDALPLPRGRSFADFLGALEGAVERGARHAVIEATSHALAQGYARAWRFDLGVFTNLSPDHLTTHGSWEHYLAAKAQLFVLLGPGRVAVLNAADPAALLLDQAIPADVTRRWYAAPHRGDRLRPADLEATRIELGPAGTIVHLAPSPAADALGGALQTRMIGEVFGENALAAALAALAAGIEPAAVARGIAAAPVVPGRFEVIDHGDDRPLCAVDYAHSPDALVHTCRTARALAGPGGRVILVFGAGGGATSEKRGPMGEVVGAAADLAIVTTDNPRREDPRAIAAALAEGVQRGGRAGLRIELDRAAAIGLALDEAAAGDVIVVAGKGHESGQEIAGRTLPFTDAQAIRDHLAGRGAGARPPRR